jgi:hypothetical protein
VVKGRKVYRGGGGDVQRKTYSVIVWEYGGRNGKPLVIGKAAKPRCVKNLKINNLSVIWRSNKKAWMTAAIMEEWLNIFSAKMKIVLIMQYYYYYYCIILIT